ncbi:hypothetical protein OP10G_0767 [Fimbriimonas ginsengisoli Gsoil 348]|uniref:Uncharacterized protein n=1 Tax=Fimbriimonas ginsengisoli Gsoil 348 TaxID=661478 RepID=A0A068NN28_FIMGI|nr:hypothetical protein OP10G_0767 [Fimbriimonas ginsengisoli Gsoil 348]
MQRPFLLGSVCALAIGVGIWFWKSGQGVLLTNREIADAIPTDLRLVPPTAQELEAMSAWEVLGAGIRGEPQLRSYWFVGDFQRNSANLLGFVPASDWLPDKVEALCALGPPGETASDGPRPDGPVFDIFRVLSMRSDFLIAAGNGSRVWPTARALARMAATIGRYRGELGQYLAGLSTPVQLALSSLIRAVDAGAFTRKQLRELDRLLPLDDALVRAMQARVPFTFDRAVVRALEVPNRESLLKPADPKAENSDRYLAGRLNVPMTLAREIELYHRFSKNIGQSAAKRSWGTTSEDRERMEYMRSYPWPRKGDPEWLVYARDEWFRFKARAWPNARGFAVGGTPTWALSNIMQERIRFALAKARIRLAIDPRLEMPIDPGDGLRIRVDPKRRVIWSVGNDGVDNGGASNPHDSTALDTVISF